MPTPFDKFTPEAQHALKTAEKESHRLGSLAIGSHHLLLGILNTKKTLAFSLLERAGINEESVSLLIPAFSEESETTGGISHDLKKILEGAIKMSFQFRHQFVGVEHLLFSLLENETSAGCKILKKMQVATGDIRKSLEDIFSQIAEGAGGMAGKPPEKMLSALEGLLNGLQGALAGMRQN